MINFRFTITVVSALLTLIFSASAFADSTVNATNDTAATTATAAASQAPKPDQKVTAYYFHGNMRCTTCTNFEAYTNELISTSFADAVKSGALEWKIVNTDKPGNEHFMKDYQLYTKSIVLVDSKDGKQLRFKNLEGIWHNTQSKARFQNYVKGEIEAYLGVR
jgi:hypothetical protein